MVLHLRARAILQILCVFQMHIKPPGLRPGVFPHATFYLESDINITLHISLDAVVQVIFQLLLIIVLLFLKPFLDGLKEMVRTFAVVVHHRRRRQWLQAAWNVFVAAWRSSFS